ncbi:hypothetical protein A2706_02345 [Candidatus Peribacteria bacterium RIFCSPHIGHO2_01_FULL_51_35]|nr:MAG: hypothetical protein A2706_02345 [Candidatus Peribacteria bacterium RIFCSPHIGHO2_01_FULL_51_35]
MRTTLSLLSISTLLLSSLPALAEETPGFTDTVVPEPAPKEKTMRELCYEELNATEGLKMQPAILTLMQRCINRRNQELENQKKADAAASRRALVGSGQKKVMERRIAGSKRVVKAQALLRQKNDALKKLKKIASRYRMRNRIIEPAKSGSGSTQSGGSLNP